MANNNGVVLSFSIASVGTRLNDIDLASRKAEEAAVRRYEAAGWLRQMVGVVGAKDFAAEPSEHFFRLGLRSGIILCNVLNKVQPGAVPNIVDTPSVVPDGAALSAFQYFENVRNFPVALQEIRLPTFEASDLEQGGNSARIVNCVLALKSYYDTKLAGGYSENLKPTNSGKLFMRKNSQPFMNSFSRNSSTNNKSLSAQLSANGDSAHNTEMNSNSLNALVRTVLSDKKPEQVPILVESMLSKVIEEYERRLASHNESMKTAIVDMVASEAGNSLPRTSSSEHEEFSNLGKYVNNLAQAASGYHRVLEENRKLYNQVQDLKGSIRVYCRVRPFMPGQPNGSSSVDHIRVYCRVRPFMPGQPNGSSSVDHIEEGTISVLTPSRHGKGCKSFKFNKVFGQSASQEEVFSDTQPLIRSVLDGFNVCIFAYGQTVWKNLHHEWT